MSAGEQGLKARRAALSLLEGVLDRHEPLDTLLDAASAALEPRDRAFARALAATTLRRLYEIDGHIDARLDRPLPAKAHKARHILRLAIAQYVFLDVPVHAAVDTAVRLTGRDRNPRVRAMKPLVNGLLRRLARDRPEALPAAEAGPRNTPGWLFKRWSDHYGEKAAAAIAAAHMAVPPLDMTLKDPRDSEKWATALDATILPTGPLRRETEGAVAGLAGYDEGAWWVQDAAAALPVRLAGDVAGQTVIDLCAAPGGKTAQLAAAGAGVVAVDQSPARLERLSENLKRLDLHAAPVAADATEWQPETPAPIVLLDAPCSSTGTIRRHPDIPHLKTAADIPALAALQEKLLANAARMVAAGGMLIYCTCSLEPEEGEEQIARFLNTHPDFARRPVAPGELPGLEEAITGTGDVRTLPSLWPNKGGMDGFFIARLGRTG